MIGHLKMVSEHMVSRYLLNGSGKKIVFQGLYLTSEILCCYISLPRFREIPNIFSSVYVLSGGLHARGFEVALGVRTMRSRDS